MGNTAPGTIILVATEASDSMAAPHTADMGRENLWSSPITILAMWGPTIPINPILPTNDTAVAVSRDLSGRDRVVSGVWNGE